MVDDEYMSCKAEGTYKHEGVAEREGEALSNAKQVHTRCGEYNAEPYNGANALFEEDACNRYKDNIESCDKAGFADRRKCDAILLKAGGDGKYKATANTAD